MSFADVYEWFFHGGFLSVILYGVMALVIALYKRDLKSLKSEAQADTSKLHQKLMDHIGEDEKSFDDIKAQGRTDTAMVLEQIERLHNDVRMIFGNMIKK